MNIYVSNLGLGILTEDLKRLFRSFGEVTTVNLVTDKFTNRSRGFGFIEMPDRVEAENAIRELNGSMVGGRLLKAIESQKDGQPQPSSFY
jgi:RNA recognition motif-containing protein